jgi:hypothetical protein
MIGESVSKLKTKELRKYEEETSPVSNEVIDRMSWLMIREHSRHDTRNSSPFMFLNGELE